MQDSTTIIITAAGIGSRLGLNIPKCLVEIEGKTIISRQLELLHEFEDVRIVVGYHAKQVIEHVNRFRKDILFVFNHNFINTTPLNSLYLASKYAKKNILYIDGDLVLTKESIESIIQSGTTSLGIIKQYSSEPVCVETKEKEEKLFITKFTRDKKKYEWAGLMYTETEKIKNKNIYVYQVFEQYMPLKANIVDVCEIDTIHDLEYAKQWIKKKF